MKIMKFDKKYKHGVTCNKQKICKIVGCIKCNYYIQSDSAEAIDYGLCNNYNSENYNCEVYDNSCCFYFVKTIMGTNN